MNKKIRLNTRIWELDFIRGVCVLLMVFDHFMFSVYLFSRYWKRADFALELIKFTTDYWNGPLRETVRPLIVFLFLFLCGISCTFSKSNLKRGLLMAVLAGLITFVTWYVTELTEGVLDISIYFGVLHMLALSVLFYGVLQIISGGNKKVTAMLSLIAGTMLCMVFTLHETGALKYPEPTGDWTGIFYEDRIFASKTADYFPFLTHGWAVFLGAAAGAVLYGKKKTLLPWLDPCFSNKYIVLSGKTVKKRVRWYRPINFVGRHGLPIYCLHQVLIFAVLLLVTYHKTGSIPWKF